jgi:hypothetical protein
MILKLLIKKSTIDDELINNLLFYTQPKNIVWREAMASLKRRVE